MTLEELNSFTDELEQVLNKYGMQIEFVAGNYGDNPNIEIRTEPLDEHKLYSRCIRCGRTLKNPIAQERGYGEVCWEKHKRSNQQTLL